MERVTVRDLRNRGGQVLDQVARGTSVLVTRDGHPIAELRPVRTRPLPAAELLARWRTVPAVDGDALRADIDSLLDVRL
ncbi:MAG TPA: type II toxin-antitoxin system prevent-host-death family antitoxin [Gemmatimonadales bacterium]|nr:type II toxin-antitoxin system prevent-host-death family antitoxin [Gemmatimonadales bacterium]